jgi:hypothetical protein
MMQKVSATAIEAAKPVEKKNTYIAVVLFIFIITVVSLLILILSV